VFFCVFKLFKKGDFMNKRSRKWLITCENPETYNYSFDFCREVMSKLKSVVYWCYSEEVGESGTHHFHLYLCGNNPIMFDTLKKRFQHAHFDYARGTSQQNRDYVFKEGKWLDDKKGETNKRGTHFEWGELPVERQGARNDLADLYDLIIGGASDIDIIAENPNYINQIDRFDKIRQSYRQKQFENQFRNLEVTYICGEAGSGKTRYVMDKFGYGNVYRVTDYVHPFDYYSGQDVILFDEFRSSIKVADMLNYLDGYPLMLPCRYNNKVACFTKVFIISNIPLENQYPKVQNEEKTTFKAFLRRIHKNYIMTPFGLADDKEPKQISIDFLTIRKSCILRIVIVFFKNQ
jgi:hypothetical protein